MEWGDNAIIYYKGFRCSLAELKCNGWCFSTKPAYDNWRDPLNSAKSHEKIYMRDPISKMIGRITRKSKSELSVGTDTPVMRPYYELDFLVHPRDQRTKPPKIFVERDLGVEDVPRLMEMILQIQEENKPKRKTDNRFLPQAEILLMDVG